MTEPTLEEAINKLSTAWEDVKQVHEKNNTDLSKITRLEVIGEKREYINMNITNLEFSYQDNNRTLKIFVNNKK